MAAYLSPSSFSTLPFNGGVYILAAELGKNYRLKVGRLGAHRFHGGTYLYVGSAQRNLKHRLRRHVSGDSNGKKFHWHIDYLLARARVRSVWCFAAPKEWECRLGRRLAGLEGVQIPLNGFGSSDCRCKTHLYYLPDAPDVPGKPGILESIIPSRTDNVRFTSDMVAGLHNGAVFWNSSGETSAQSGILESIDRVNGNLTRRHPPRADRTS